MQTSPRLACVSVLSAALLASRPDGSAQKVDPRDLDVFVVIQFPGATQAPTVTTFAIGADGKAESFTHEEMGTFMRVREKK